MYLKQRSCLRYNVNQTQKRQSFRFVFIAVITDTYKQCGFHQCFANCWHKLAHGLYKGIASGFLVGPLCFAVKAMADFANTGEEEVKEETPDFDDDAGWHVN